MEGRVFCNWTVSIIYTLYFSDVCITKLKGRNLTTTNEQMREHGVQEEFLHVQEPVDFSITILKALNL